MPEFCGFDCPFAEFPPAESAGLCRTMAAVWCRKQKKLAHKNRPCPCRKAEAARPDRKRNPT